MLCDGIYTTTPPNTNIQASYLIYAKWYYINVINYLIWKNPFLYVIYGYYLDYVCDVLKIYPMKVQQQQRHSPTDTTEEQRKSTVKV